MATSRIPNTVLDKLNNLIKRFFWGKMDKPRYLAYVAGDRLCLPRGMGGLGFKDLKSMNEAMLLKLLWRLASNSNSQWAQLVRAKYLVRSALWRSKQVYNCTVFWRSLMGLRNVLLPLVRWEVGDGRTCHAIGEPWCEGIMGFQPESTLRGREMVRDLMDSVSGTWDTDKLIRTFGHVACLNIVATVRPPREEAGSDRMIFSLTSNGNYSVKKMYAQITNTGRVVGEEQSQFWHLIWKRSDLLPLIRLFMWNTEGIINKLNTIAVRMGGG